MAGTPGVRSAALSTVAPVETAPGREQRTAVAVGAAVLVLGYLPLTFLGPGTDLDVGGVWRSGRAILDGDYQVSRLPGAPVFEALAGALHAVGGPTLVNLGSLAMAVATVTALVALLRAEGVPHAAWAGVAVLVHPVVWIAGTSMVDFLWATGLLLSGAVLRRRTPVVAGVLWALAVGCRASTLLLVGALVVADLVDADGGARRAALRSAVVAVVLTMVIYVPPFLEHGTGLIDSGVASSSALVQLGRFGVKNLFFFGPVVVVLVAALLPRLLRAGRERWRTSWLVRAGLLVVVVSEVLFLRFPWKLAHLIPVLLGLLLLLGGARLLSPRILAVLIAAHLLLGIVNVRWAEPDQPNRASGAELAPAVVEGQLVRDVRCRLDGDRDAYRRADGLDELSATWNCATPWGDEGDPAPG